MQQHSSRWQQLLYLAIIGLFIWIIYYPSLSVPFIFDDIPNIVRNDSVQPETFTDFLNVIHSPVNDKRILSFFSFALNYYFDGLHVFGYHLVNILIHMFNGFFLFFLLRNLQLLAYNKDQAKPDYYHIDKIAFWATLLWAVNPVQTQAVTYIVQRMTSLAALFYILALLLFTSYLLVRKRRWLYWVGILLCFLLGFISKEHVATLPLTLYLTYWLFSGDSKKNIVLTGIVLVTAIVAGLCLYGKQYFPEDWFATYSGRNFSAYERVITQPRMLWHYLSLYTLPYIERLHLHYNPEVSRSLLVPLTTLFSIISMVLVVAVTFLLKEKYRLFSYGVLFFYLASSIEASFLGLELAFIHRLYLPSIFIIAGVLSLLEGKQLQKIFTVLLVLAALWGFWTMSRNVEWQQASRLWNIENERYGKTGRAVNNYLRSTFNSSGVTEEMMTELDAALSIASAKEKRALLFNKAYFLYINEQYVDALQALEELKRGYGYFEYAAYLEGMLNIKLGVYDQVDVLIEALAQKEDYFSFQGDLLKAELLSAKKEYLTAIDFLKKHPKNRSKGEIREKTLICDLLARLYNETGQTEKEYEQYLTITRLNPEAYLAWKQIYEMLKVAGDEENAQTIRSFLEKKGIQVEQ